VGATVGQIAGRPTDFYGKNVILTTTVHQVLGPHSFTAGDGSLLVVDMLPLPKLAPGDPVQVAGKVQRFDLAEIDRQIASPVNNAALAMWVGRPAVIANNVNPFRPPAPGVGR
jgi:hypothetical protein